MARSRWKGFFIDRAVLKNIVQPVKQRSKWVKVWSRCSIIPAKYVGKKVLIHTGNAFRRLYIRLEHVGFRFGEFAQTRKPQRQFNLKKKVEKNKKIKK